MRVERLERIAVELRRSHAAAERRAQHQRHGASPLRAESHARDLLTDLVKRLVRKAEKLDLGDRPHSRDGEPQRRADDRCLGQRHVDHARLAVLRLETVGRAEHAAQRADVLAQDHHARVGGHRFVEAGADRLDHRQHRHQRSFRAESVRWRSSRAGGSA